jgi:hypothetical protein
MDTTRRSKKLARQGYEGALGIIAAMKEYIRRKKLEGIIGAEGKLHFSDDWEKARHER